MYIFVFHKRIFHSHFFLKFLKKKNYQSNPKSGKKDGFGQEIYFCKNSRNVAANY